MTREVFAALRRKSHRKSRAGCRNCKTRHVKCDERRPRCGNCTRVNLRCSGYDGCRFNRPASVAVHQDLQDFRDSFLSSPAQPSLALQPLGEPLGCNDILALQFFQIKTLPSIQSVFPSEIWERSLLAIGHSVLAIMHLVIAISTYHRRTLVQGVSAWKKASRTDLADPTALYALKHHGEAARLMRESLGSDNPPIRIVKLACILFTMLEFWRGNQAETIAHLLSGMSLLKLQPPSQQQDPFEKEVDSTLSRLSLLQSLCGRPRRTMFPNLWIVPMTSDGSCPESFSSLQDARTSILNLCNMVFTFVRKVENSQLSPQTAGILVEQRYLDTQLQQWSKAIENLACTITDHFGQRAADLLRCCQSIAMMFLTTITTQYQTSWDQFIAKFRWIVEKLESLLESSRASDDGPVLFSLDLGIIPCLFYTAIKCRHPKIRRRAVALLRKAPLREGLWNAEEAAVVAEQAIKFEEVHLMNAENEKFSWYLPEECRIHDVDIRETSVGGQTSLSIAFRCRPYALCDELEETLVDVKLYDDG